MNAQSSTPRSSRAGSGAGLVARSSNRGPSQSTGSTSSARTVVSAGATRVSLAIRAGSVMTATAPLSARRWASSSSLDRGLTGTPTAEARAVAR
ncbi:hypothetical protein G443_001195 [Actinoalloteichus cyanogriseus DSM 43889]|uniref:Uncharacterized protein n=1 Tax=Actinoalloteichus caeruleus DSM 43889 TaxID=1120930 RepID=A0ABT1JEJ9_ACTCY|nr:hypothetical protein [Actinoalloteichus caeruleus DSM 43889]